MAYELKASSRDPLSLFGDSNTFNRTFWSVTIYTTKIIESVCLSGYAFRHILRYRAESWLGGRERSTRFVCILSKRPLLGSKFIRGSIWNALWLPNLVRRNPNESVVHCWGQRPCRGHWGDQGSSFFRNALWPPHFVGRTPEQSVMHYRGQRSCRAQLGSSRVQFA